MLDGPELECGGGSELPNKAIQFTYSSGPFDDGRQRQRSVELLAFAIIWNDRIATW